MEPDEPEGSPTTFPAWVSLEYAQMLFLAGEGSEVIFSSLSSASVNSLHSTLQKKKAGKSSSNFRTEVKPVLELMKQDGVDITRVCLLDPKAPLEISPDDADKFDWFLFGGILGDDPPRDRTGELRKLGFPSRHLGPIQMTTDTALGVTKICVKDGVPLNKISFIDHPTIRFDEVESVEMPFRYVTDSKGEPILPPGMKELLHADMDKGFDEM